jgi:hypothetical protein
MVWPSTPVPNFVIASGRDGDLAVHDSAGEHLATLAAGMPEVQLPGGGGLEDGVESANCCGPARSALP